MKAHASKILIIILITAQACGLTACGDDEIKSAIHGTWTLDGYESVVEASDGDKKAIAKSITNSLPFAGAKYVFDANGTVTAYPYATADKRHVGYYVIEDNKLSLYFSYGGGLEYKAMDIILSENTLSVSEDMTLSYSNTTSASRVMRIHRLTRTNN